MLKTNPFNTNNSKVNWKYNHSFVFILFSIIIFVFHIVTLQRSPLPWFDEVFFANMTKSLQSSGKLYLPMSTGQYEGEEILHYGPIYFYTQAFITKWLGFGLLQFRTLNFLSGVGILVIMIQIARKLFISPTLVCFLFLFLIFDPAISSNMHSGRMDALAMFLFLLGFYFYFVSSKSLKSSIFASLLFSFSILTTPRIGFLFLVLPVKMFYDYLFTRCSFNYLIKTHVLVYIIIFTSFLCWIFFKIGSINDYILLFSQNSTFETLYTLFHLPPIYQLPAFIYFCFLFIYLLVNLLFKKDIVFDKKIDKSLVVSIIIMPFIYIVFIKGGYTIYLMPFLYLAILNFINFLQKSNISIKIHSIILSVLLAINVFLFLYKSIILISSWNSRNSELFSSFFFQKRIFNENILASHQFFYQVQKNNNFISNDDNRSIDFKKADSLNLTKAFIAKNKYAKDSLFFNSLGYKVVDSLITPKEQTLFVEDLIGRFKLDIIQDYDCYYLIRK